MTGQRSALLLLLSLELAAAFFPTRHLRSLVEKRDSCDLSSCLATFLDHGYGSPYDGFMPGLQRGEVESMCRDFVTMNVCMEDKLKSCSAVLPMTQILADSMVELEGWMCSDAGKQVAQSEPAECWNNPEAAAAFTTCDDDGPLDPCQSFQAFRDCVKNEYGSRCSPRAADYIEGIIYHYQKPGLEYAVGGCDQEGPTLSN